MTAERKFIPAFLSWLTSDNEALTLYFDLCMSYGAEHSSEVTTHPVEQGANIADHVRVKPLQLKLDVFVSNSPIEDLPDGSRQKKFSSVPLRYPSPEAAAIGPQTLNGYTFSGPNADYIASTYAVLQALHDQHILVTVTTPIRPYDDMVMTGLKFVRDTNDSGDAGKFAIELEQITIVSSDVVSSAVIPQAKPEEPVGQTDTEQADQDAPRESVLSWGLGKIGQ
jgi:hypothetical protein